MGRTSNLNPNPSSGLLPKRLNLLSILSNTGESWLIYRPEKKRRAGESQKLLTFKITYKLT